MWKQQDGIAGIGDVPIIATDLTLNYAYSKNGNSQNPLFGKNISKLSCGYSTCLACSEDGFVYIRQISLVSGASQWSPVSLPSSFLDPYTFQPITNVKCSDVELGGKLGDETLFVLTISGYVFSWGSYNKDIRGHGVDGTFVSIPTLIPTLKGIYHLSSTPDFANSQTCAIVGFANSTGAYLMGWNLYSFGTGVDYQTYDHPVYVPLDYVTSGQIRSMHFGMKHVLFLTENGHVYTMGDNDDRQVLPSGGNGNIPTLTNLTSSFTNVSSKIVECSVSNDACLCISANGDVFTWGNLYQAGISNNNVVNFGWIDTQKSKIIVAIWIYCHY
ncbi:hypothetical protein FDP41_000317 [Naegleria fowleri]|uniref:Uncharacterized protein n=1 Tax=Naegleria fowleri TaxID=5763 RepID=A0A6A5CGG5_NAEFO|nr:uncharacterized protein FDP41_000317 [Naegleria fowleri]KAF0984418.1 hypothetical protein FDP41_000317 [Naegleria fowleri]